MCLSALQLREVCIKKKYKYENYPIKSNAVSLSRNELAKSVWS